mmetsp:Transcript_34594/g.88528  ORF Transcript_34594/g.88528 Transcript_34594/m.88528 type:complete len:242 (-) Transcript_34594:316-1041(-)
MLRWTARESFCSRPPGRWQRQTFQQPHTRSCAAARWRRSTLWGAAAPCRRSSPASSSRSSCSRSPASRRPSRPRRSRSRRRTRRRWRRSGVRSAVWACCGTRPRRIWERTKVSAPCASIFCGAPWRWWPAAMAAPRLSGWRGMCSREAATERSRGRAGRASLRSCRWTWCSRALDTGRCRWRACPSTSAAASSRTAAGVWTAWRASTPAAGWRGGPLARSAPTLRMPTTWWTPSWRTATTR